MFFPQKTLIHGLILMLASMQYGFSLNYGGIAVNGLKEKYPEWDMNKDQKNIDFFINFPSLFGAFGGFSIRFLAYVTSARKALVIFGVINIIAWFIYLAMTPKLFIMGVVLRSVQGFLAGGFACLTPMMMTNISPEENIGFFGCLNQVSIVFAMVLFSILAAFVDFKIIAIIGAVLNIIYCGVIWLPPEYKKERGGEPIYQRKNVVKIIIGVFLMIFQQFSGINAILNDLGSIMSGTGISIDSNLQSAIATLAQFLGVFVSAFNMDVIGRKKSWILSAVGVVIGLILYLVCLSTKTEGYLQASVVFFFQLSFGYGYGPIPWFICHDLFPRWIRLDAQMYLTFANMMGSYAVVNLYPYINKKYNSKITILIFAIISVFAIPFGAVCIPKKSENHDEVLTMI